jgi:hypothetical protein
MWHTTCNVITKRKNERKSENETNTCRKRNEKGNRGVRGMWAESTSLDECENVVVGCIE